MAIGSAYVVDAEQVFRIFEEAVVWCWYLVGVEKFESRGWKLRSQIARAGVRSCHRGLDLSVSCGQVKDGDGSSEAGEYTRVKSVRRFVRSSANAKFLRQGIIFSAHFSQHRCRL